MAGKRCTTTEEPSLVTARYLADGLYDIQINEGAEAATLYRRNHESGETEEISAYVSTLYMGVIEADTRAEFISNGIHIRYSIDDEIALIHKYAEDADDTEYAAYQELRAAIKDAAASFFEEAE